ncbi:hypothetical protein BGZ96_009481 [Linnemannia gamsii]|uniref:Uncharacterized protein n=1 Tax=Linnemannia gamsii TaxID=64522 RepID=A0ABQ7JY28_9FUNG|nr:hypothetical protein BGZ96_009481 [Linnemannia gamsii]
MTTVAERLGEAHEQLLKLYTSIPVLTPCLESIKSNQAEFVVLNSRLRNLQELITACQYRAEKTRKQLDSVFTINKGECERTYRQETNDLKTYEDERRICLRQRDDVVTVVFDRSKDEVANTDFPEELYWQLELKEYDIKITEVRNSVSKFNIALTSLARAANLTEAALMALLGYPDAAYKVWRVEYALKASQKMRLYLRVELSLSNAYSNADSAREACPNVVSLQAPPVKPSAAQSYFEPITKNAKGKYKIVPFDSEAPLREYIARLRTSHKTAERMLAQETERLNAMQRYRESIIPRLAQIRRHVFQNYRLNGYQIEGWEDAMGRSLLGTEADILVRGGIHDVGTSSNTSPLGSQARPPLSTSSSQSVPNNSSSDSFEEDEETMNTVHSRGERRGSGRGVPDVDDQGSSSDPNRPMTVHDIRVVLSVGRAPLSTVAPGNMLGSEVLMQVDRQRQAQEIKDRERVRARSRSRSGREPEPSSSSGSGSSDHQQRQGSNGFSTLGGNSTNSSSNNQSTNFNSSSGEREGRKKSRGLFSFARGRRGSSSNRASDIGDAVVPSVIPPTPPIFQLSGRNNQSSIDISNNVRDRIHSSRDHESRHRRNVPSISISNEDDEGGLPPHPLRRTMLDNASLIQLPSSMSTSSFRSIGSSAANNTSNDAPPPPFSMPSRPRVMSMDEYVGVGPVVRGDGDEPIRPFEDVHGSGPLIPSYGEHEQHQSIDPESMMITGPSGAFNGSGLGSLTEHDEEMEAQNLLLGRTSPPAPPPGSSSSSVFQPRHRSTQSIHLPLPSPGGRSRSRSLSPHPLSPYSYSMIPAAAGSNSSLSSFNGNTTRTGRAPYQHHHYSFSDQTPDGSTLSLSVPPPDYAVHPPEYSPSPPSVSLVFPTAISTTIASPL